jgi:hypothetical protein
MNSGPAITPHARSVFVFMVTFALRSYGLPLAGRPHAQLEQPLLQALRPDPQTSQHPDGRLVGCPWSDAHFLTRTRPFSCPRPPDSPGIHPATGGSTSLAGRPHRSGAALAAREAGDQPPYREHHEHQDDEKREYLDNTYTHSHILAQGITADAPECVEGAFPELRL